MNILGGELVFSLPSLEYLESTPAIIKKKKKKKKRGCYEAM